MEVPSREIHDSGQIYAEGVFEDSKNAPVMDIQIIDHDFIRLMGVQFVKGKNLKRGKTINVEEAYNNDPINYLKTRKREYIINETALRMIGWKNAQEALGKRFSWGNGFVDLQKGKIVGVIKDYHQETMKNLIDPLVIISEPLWFNNFLIKLDGKNIHSTVKSIENIWKKYFPDYSMEYSFLDDLYNKLYETERKQLELIYIFSSLAIMIAFLGIFGLLSYTLKTREKEIAIRKVLGANLKSLIVLISKKFIILTILGMFLAIPFTWFTMRQWLQNFVYRVDIQMIDFIIPLLLIISILIFTILSKIRKVAKENPANILRSE